MNIEQFYEKFEQCCGIYPFTIDRYGNIRSKVKGTLSESACFCPIEMVYHHVYPDETVLPYDRAICELGLTSEDGRLIMDAADGFMEFLNDQPKEIRRKLLSMIEKVYDDQKEDVNEIYIWPEKMYLDFTHLHPISDSKEEEASK